MKEMVREWRQLEDIKRCLCETDKLVDDVVQRRKEADSRKRRRRRCQDKTTSTTSEVDPDEEDAIERGCTRRLAHIEAGLRRRRAEEGEARWLEVRRSKVESHMQRRPSKEAATRDPERLLRHTSSSRSKRGGGEDVHRQEGNRLRLEQVCKLGVPEWRKDIAACGRF